KGAQGGEAPDLHKSRLVLAGSAAALFQVVREGIPGTEMPGLIPVADQAWQVVSYLHSLTRPGLGPPVPGDPVKGSAIFEQHGCSRCHMVGGRGGAVGPDLSSIALQVPTARIRKSIVNPDARIADRYKTITVSLKSNGRKITGTLKNEDNFSLQIMTTDGEYALLDRAGIAQDLRPARSLMPAGYGSKLSVAELQDLLAYLDRQRAPFLRYEATFANH